MSIPGNWGLCSYLLLFSCSVVSYSLWPHGLQQARLPCPSLSPGVFSNSRPLSQWCYPTISLILCHPFLFLPSVFPSIRIFSSQLFSSGVQSIGASASASVLPRNIQGWFPLGLNGWISLLSKGLTRAFSNTTVQKHQFFGAQPYLNGPTLTSIHDYWKIIALTIWTFVGQVVSLLFNMFSGFVIAFLPRSKHLLLSWLQSPSAVILEPPKIKSATVSTVSPSICHEVKGPDAMILIFLNAEF